MERQKVQIPGYRVRLAGHRARSVGSLLGLSLCLAIGMLLGTAGTALALSGFASDQDAVGAQYPDMTNPNAEHPQGQAPVFSNLGNVIQTTRGVDRDPKVARRFRAARRQIIRKATKAVLSAADFNPRQSGSIALLVIAIAVLSVGGLLRWRRGLTQT